jgi:hypothetical protein
MKQEMANLVEFKWDPATQLVDTFGTGSAQNLARGDYFLESANQINFFAEPDALTDDQRHHKPEYTATTATTTTINGIKISGNTSNKITALNKAGHGLHLPSAATTQSHSSADCSSKNPAISKNVQCLDRSLLLLLLLDDGAGIVPVIQDGVAFDVSTLAASSASRRSVCSACTRATLCCVSLFVIVMPLH